MCTNHNEQPDLGGANMSQKNVAAVAVVVAVAVGVANAAAAAAAAAAVFFCRSYRSCILLQTVPVHSTYFILCESEDHPQSLLNVVSYFHNNHCWISQCY